MAMQKLLTLVTATVLAVAPVFAHGEPEHGGQIVEVQEHQFELVVEPEANGTHLDFYISDPGDRPVSTATVKLQITAPDGRRIALPLRYAQGHYTAMLPSGAKGEYRVVALTDIGGRKLNSRFTFKL